MMDLINQGATALNSGLTYLQDNALALLACVVILYGLRGFALDRMDSSKQGSTLSSTKSSDDHRQEMMRVRMRQQEEAQKQSLEGSKLRQIKEDEVKKRKNEAALHEKKKNKGGVKLGTASSNASGSGSGGFNPMQPWSANAGGGGYKYVILQRYLLLFLCSFAGHLLSCCVSPLTDLHVGRPVAVDESSSSDTQMSFGRPSSTPLLDEKVACMIRLFRQSTPDLPLLTPLQSVEQK
jgi:hypothetical protein